MRRQLKQKAPGVGLIRVHLAAPKYFQSEIESIIGGGGGGGEGDDRSGASSK